MRRYHVVHHDVRSSMIVVLSEEETTTRNWRSAAPNHIGEEVQPQRPDPRPHRDSLRISEWPQKPNGRPHHAYNFFGVNELRLFDAIVAGGRPN